MKEPRPVLNLRFVDHDPSYDPTKGLLWRLISERYDIDTAVEPDYIISCGLGYDHTRYERAVKIVWIGENRVPDFNWFDYAIGFDRLDFGDRYLRMPLYAFYRAFETLGSRPPVTEAEVAARKFCCFVVSNPSRDPICFEFADALSKYRQVDFGGAYRNNVGGRVKDKLAFCRGYKFNIAFENSSVPGYVTEKIMEPLSVGSVPVYYGDPTIGLDFREEAFVRVRGRGDIERAVAEIAALDRDDAAYLRMANAPCLVDGGFDERCARLRGFLFGIFERPREDAYRRAFHGNQPSERRYQAPVLRTYAGMRAAAWCLARKLKLR